MPANSTQTVLRLAAFRLARRTLWLAALCVAWTVGNRALCASAYYVGQAGIDPRQGPTVLPGRIYDGSSADKLDDFLRKVPENSIIQFGRARFETRGVWDVWLGDQSKGFRVKNGWTLVGAGTNSQTGTILRLADVPVDASTLYNMNVVLSTGGVGQYRSNQPRDRRPNVEGVSIRDLQIDCNYPNLAKAKETAGLQLSAIQILGNRGLNISNVWVRNAASKKLDGRGQQFECFQVYLYNRWAQNVPGTYYVDRVVVSEYQGGNTSAICVNGNARGFIQNCAILFSPEKTQRYGLNFAAGINNFTIANNTVLNASRGINNDTGPICTNVTIARNRFVNCTTGLLLADSEGSQILENTIGLDGAGAGIAVRYHPTLKHVKSRRCLIQGNLLLGRSGEGISLGYESDFDPRHPALYWSSNNVVQNNVLSPGLQSKIPPYSAAPNIVRSGNRRHSFEYPACPGPGGQANLAAIGFPSDIGLGAGCQYCQASAADSRCGYIARVKVAGTKLDLVSDQGDGSGYSDFTTGYGPGVGKSRAQGPYYVQWCDLQRGRRYQLDVEGADLRDVRATSMAVYIDWNHDGTFNAPGEMVASATGQSSIAASLVIPTVCPLGSTRMRVILAYGKAPGPCAWRTFSGEVEDYTINVSP